MASTISVTLGERLDCFIEKMIATGRYGASSEVIKRALRLIYQTEHTQNLLRKALDAGE
ncbi:antitoxin, partial (plasmid) [Vibrio parahaemolyticus]|uniref:type II toxin-antitoxin system ParD family antitoxin n=1 Tax=Vibrio parahaemolyticus TaxID=670 RepID=UPI00062AF5D7